MFDTIVIGYDDSDRSHDALALAAALADDDTELVLCCVHPQTVLTSRIAPHAHGADSREDALRRLEAGRARLGDRAGVRVLDAVATSAAAGLHAVAEEVGADLLVVGSTHRGRLGRVVLGTTASHALHAPPCAVAVAPGGRPEPSRIELRDIGIGLDAGAESHRALRTAETLAGQRGATVHVFTIVEPVTGTFGWAGAWMYPEYHEDAVRIARERVAEALAELDHAAPVRTHVLEGIPAEQLLRASQRMDLLVLGSRGYGPIGRALTGSVAAEVCASSACPVLVLPRSAPPVPAEGLAGETTSGAEAGRLGRR